MTAPRKGYVLASDTENLLEAHVHDFIEANIAALLGAGAKVLERESVLPFGRIDLLCEDGKGDLIAVEVKRGQVGRDAIGQLLAYLGGLRERNPDRHIRGVIVGGNLDAAAAAALKAVSDVDFVSYEISFTLKMVHKGARTEHAKEEPPPPPGDAGTLNLTSILRLFGLLVRFSHRGTPLPVGMKPESAFRQLQAWVEAHDYGWQQERSALIDQRALFLSASNAKGRTIEFGVRVDSLEINISGSARYLRVLVASERRELAWLKS